MRRVRSGIARLAFSLFVLAALFIGGLFGSRHNTRVFIALLTLAWHFLANMFCAFIASYRFGNPEARYIRIKNPVIRWLFVRPYAVGGVPFAGRSDDRANVIGLVLNILNTVLFVSFEILLFMPPIPCEPYTFSFVFGSRPWRFSGFELEFHSWNEIISAEAPMLFALAMALTLLVFVALFEHQLKKLRRAGHKRTEKASQKKPRE